MTLLQGVVSFGLIFFYGLMVSGVMFNAHHNPQAVGSTMDSNTKIVKPVAFYQYRINTQYVFEGLSTGIAFSLGGLGFILASKVGSTSSALSKLLYFLFGCGTIILFYNISILFMRIKAPGYLA
eukprot:GILI01038543.1.p1 GENE.GILI01038543.1~~GILI01038543.1.p1  ORF type:complete len:124 (-),score=2.63 GILI01038543.1:163-534(-)